MRTGANECISKLYFEYQRLRRILETIKSAHEVARDAMRRQFVNSDRDIEDVEIRTDMGMRLGVLGIGSAAVSIISALAISGDTMMLLIGMGLSSTALFGLYWLKTAANSQLPFLAVGGYWIAGLAFSASAYPLEASLALFASAYYFGRAKVFQSRKTTEAESQENESLDTVEIPSEERGLILDQAGCLATSVQLGSLQLTIGEQLAQRVHLTDRVQFLRTISDIRTGAVPSQSLKVRVNTAERADAPSFEEFMFDLSMRGAQLELRQIPIYVAKENDFEVEVEPGSDKRFLTIVSHELRTPLNAIIGFSDVLRCDVNGELPEATRNEYVDLIHGAGSHLLSLVNTILDVSKIESGTYTIDCDEFDFPQTARECMAMLGAQAKQKNILINDRIVSSSMPVTGDRRAIKQILINLLSNAIKYTEPNGFVTVDAKTDENGLVFEVSDTGIGMCPDDLEIIGKPFAQVDNSITRTNEGTGLGLALVKGLVELHDGSLEISSKLGVGTNVKIRIPNEQEQKQGSGLTQLNSLGNKNTYQSIARKEIGHVARKAG